jgi:hypothetical protein
MENELLRLKMIYTDLVLAEAADAPSPFCHNNIPILDVTLEQHGIVANSLVEFPIRIPYSLN